MEYVSLKKIHYDRRSITKKAAPKDGADYSDTMQDSVLYGWHSEEPGRN